MIRASDGSPSSGLSSARWGARRRSHLTGFRLAGIALVLGLLVAACSSNSATSGPPKGGTPISGGTVTFAEEPGAAPVYIFPMYSLEFYSNNNTALLENLLYPPLYWFGQGNTLNINPSLSLADPPVYSDNDRTVTITLKSGIKWSDGQTLTSRDVEFWINLLRANKADYGPYVPGTFPDNLASADYPNAQTIVLHLTSSYNPQWFTYTALSEITPIPQHAWDRTSLSGPIGNYDLTTSGAHAVYNLLNKQSLNTSAYASSPLWKVVDGAWRLLSNTPTGRFTFVPNTTYFGPKARISKLVELPFTSSTAENNALLTGSVDYGYVSATDTPEIPRLQHSGMYVSPWPIWGVNYLYVNYTNPTSAPFMKQQYVRIAMQELIDQPLLVKSIYNGYAYPTYGPVPDKPVTSFASSSELNPTYAYNPTNAVALLRSHGWDVVPNGTTTCTDPTKCGAGITQGMPLAITAIQPTGFPEIDDMMAAIQSSMTAAGIKMSLVGLTNNGIGAILAPCKAGSPCKWGLIDYEVGYYFAPGPYPDGGAPFGTGAALYEGSAPYSTPLDSLIAKVRTVPGSQATSALYTYEKYVEQENPNLWIPMIYNQISIIKDTLQGTLPQNPVAGNMTPQLWYFTK